jgi:hypothetical protein
MTTNIIFSGQLVKMKVVENFVSFTESIRTQISEFVCGRYEKLTNKTHTNPNKMRWRDGKGLDIKMHHSN